MHPERNSEVVLKVKIGNFPMSYYLVPPPLFYHWELSARAVYQSGRQCILHGLAALLLSCMVVSCRLLSKSGIFTDPPLLFKGRPQPAAGVQSHLKTGPNILLQAYVPYSPTSVLHTSSLPIMHLQPACLRTFANATY